MPKDETLALLTIKSPGKMPKEVVSNLAAWLRQTARDLEKDHANYTDKVYHGRFNK